MQELLCCSSSSFSCCYYLSFARQSIKLRAISLVIWRTTESAISSWTNYQQLASWLHQPWLSLSHISPEDILLTHGGRTVILVLPLLFLLRFSCSSYSPLWQPSEAWRMVIVATTYSLPLPPPSHHSSELPETEAQGNSIHGRWRAGEPFTLFSS